MNTALEVVRRWLLIILAIGLVGLEVELLLLKHFDGVWQLVPVALIGVGMLGLIWHSATRSAASVQFLRFIMALCIASGGIGVIQHFRGNVAYERDSNPSLSGLDLYKAALMGSTPSLAPGAMVQLGLIGLLFTYRHPSLARETRDEVPTPSRNTS